MRRQKQRVLRLLALSALLHSSCRAPEADSHHLVPLERGAFLSRSGVTELALDEEAKSEYTDLWSPRSARRLSGWGSRLGGWRPAGRRSTLLLRRGSSEATELFLDLKRPRRGGADAELTVEISVNGATLEELPLVGGPNELRVAVSPELLRDVNRVELRFEPRLEGGSDRSAPTLRRIGLLRPGVPVPSPDAAGIGGRLDPSGSRLQLASSGTYLVPIEIPAAASELRFALRHEAPSGDARPSLRLSAVDLAGERHELSAFEARGHTGDWRAERVPLGELPGQSIFLALDAELPLGGRFEVRELRFDRSDGELSQSEPDRVKRDRPEKRPDNRPDIVVVILDAARGDRFANPESSQPTSPRIDALARDALAFRSAFSECANTSCSIPNLVTGLPFLNGPPLGLRLAEEAVTLAEQLREAGYRTVGFSANPYNSETWNLHQGFEDFVAMWRQVDDAYDPFALSEMAAEVIAAQPLEEPLFLQLHYLPPHHPYDPPPEFDLFTDPSYAGQIRPDLTIRPYNEGTKRLAAEDLAHLNGLYDGVVRMADAAVGRVLDALRESGRWERSVVLVTSDHGEAFMEHGRLGHNSTLYDEMLRVPFVLRLPSGERPPDVDLDRLVALSDVVPTVLGLVGLEPASEVAGIDLLAPGAGSSQRVIFTRTSSPTLPWLSARTARWKLIVEKRRGRQMLFDLEADPAEKKNLVLERPLLFAGMGLLLREHLERSARLDLEADRAEETEVEREVLQALGYLD